jgi:hypothetical protein
MVHNGILARGRHLQDGSREIASIPATDQPLKRLGSKRLQLNKGGGATPFLLRDLEDGDVKFDPHRPYQLSLSLHRTCEIREAAKGSNKKV